MKRTIFLLAAAIAFSAPAALTIDPVAYAAAVSDSNFVTTAGVSGTFEIESSRLAVAKSQDTRIKAFAQRMISDHTQIANDLESTVKASGEKTPLPADLDAKHKQMIDQLTKANGVDFNRLYVKMQVQGHKEAVDLFSTFAKSGRNAMLKSFAQKTLPMIEDHYKQIKSISGQV